MNIRYNKRGRPVAEMLIGLSAVIFIFAGCGGSDLGKRLETAHGYLESMDYGNAIALYNQIIAENESCTEAYIGLADAYSKKNNMDKSLEILTRGLELADDTQAVEESINSLFPDYFEDPQGYTASKKTDTEAEETDTETTETTAPETSAAEEETETASEELSESESEEETEEETTTTITETETTTASTVPTTVTTTVTTTPTTTTAPVTTSPPVTTTPRVTTTPAATEAPRVTTAPRTATAQRTTTTAKVFVSTTVKDFTGMDKDEVKAWCRENDVKLYSSGSGKVVSQSPAPGSETDEDTEIIIICE